MVLSSGGAEQWRAEFEGEFRHLSAYQDIYAVLTDSLVQTFAADGLRGSATVPADGRQVVFFDSQIVVMGLHRLEAYTIG